MDPVLMDILLDGVTKYLTGTRQTKYIVGSNRKKKNQSQRNIKLMSFREYSKQYQ